MVTAFRLVGFDEAYKIGERAPHVISPRFATLQHVANLPGLLLDWRVALGTFLKAFFPARLDQVRGLLWALPWRSHDEFGLLPGPCWYGPGDARQAAVGCGAWL